MQFVTNNLVDAGVGELEADSLRVRKAHLKRSLDGSSLLKSMMDMPLEVVPSCYL